MSGRAAKTAKARNMLFIVMRYVVLIALGITMILPLLWMITVALKSNDTVFLNPPQWIPKEFVWKNFQIGTVQIDFWRKMLNTTIVAVLSVVGQVISCTLVGYAIARIKFPGRKIWFYLIIGSMMLPGFISLIPIFKLFSSLGFYNTWIPLILPNFLGAPFFIFLLRQFMMSIPKSFDEAAKMDGASHLHILFKILVPMLKPAIAVIVIQQVMSSWNDYLGPLIYIGEAEKQLLSVGMAQFTGRYASSMNLFMAADLIYMLPMLVLFIAAQKYFMQGLGSLNNAALK